MDKEIIVTNKEAFVDEFMGEYLSKGFGAMPKREIDILLLNLLMKLGNI